MTEQCRFIVVSEQLTTMIEPIFSRCIVLRIPLTNNVEILDVILHFTNKENKKIPSSILINIIDVSNNEINLAI